MAKFGFKELTLANWLEVGEPSSMFVRLAEDGTTEPITKEYWAQNILEMKLDDAVPMEVQGLFEVARGVMLYGYFFYPLYTLGQEQLLRVAEAAVTHKCIATGAPKKISTFEKKVDYLIANGSISEQGKDDWDAIRKLRNMASHPHQQQILTPGLAIRYIQHIADKINRLFQ